MDRFKHSDPELVREIVEHLLVKFEDLPAAQRKQVVSASIEAVAWIAASESAVHCEKNGKNIREARERTAACHTFFAAELERDLINCSI